MPRTLLKVFSVWWLVSRVSLVFTFGSRPKLSLDQAKQNFVVMVDGWSVNLVDTSLAAAVHLLTAFNTLPPAKSKMAARGPSKG